MSPDTKCVRLAARQHGLISRLQALAAGLSDDAISRRLERGHWSTFYPGIYVVGGAPFSWWQGLWAARLWAGHDAYFTGRTGVLLNRLDGVRGGAIEITTPHRFRSPDDNVKVRYTSRPPDRLAVIDGLAVAPVERVLLDLAAVEYKVRTGIVLDDALRKQRTSIRELHDFIATHGHGLWGCKRLRQLLAERPLDEVILASNLEKKFAGLLDHTSLPTITRHHEITLVGGIPTELDFAYPHVKLAPETDGYRWHTGLMRWQQDLDRANALAEVGWLLLKFSWRDVTRRPGYVVSKIRATIAERETLFRDGPLHP